MKRIMKKIWNNRIFRTFLQTFLSTIFVYFSSNEIFNFDMSALRALFISALSTGLAAIMPLFKIDENKEEE